MSTTTTTPGQIGYDAYGSAAQWRTFDGRPMPTWADLGTSDTGRETQRRWEVAADAIGRAAVRDPSLVHSAAADARVGRTMRRIPE